MLIDGVRGLCQAGTVLEKFQNIRRAEKLYAVLGRVAGRLEQSKRNEVCFFAGKGRGGILRLLGVVRVGRKLELEISNVYKPLPRRI